MGYYSALDKGNSEIGDDIDEPSQHPSENFLGAQAALGAGDSILNERERNLCPYEIYHLEAGQRSGRKRNIYGFR